MAQLQIDLSASRGLYKRIDGASFSATPKNNLIYDADNGEVISGVYNPFRQPGYIAPAVNAWANLSFDMPNSTVSVSKGILSGIIRNSESDGYIVSTTDYQIVPDLSLPYLSSTKFQFLVDTTPPTNLHAMFLGELGGVQTVFAVSNNRIQTTPFDDAYSTGIVKNDWNSAIASNPAGFNDLNGNNLAGFVDGRNRILYVYDEFAIHSIDGSDVVLPAGIFNANTLTFPKNLFIAHGAEFRGKVYFTYNLDTNETIGDESNNQVSSSGCGVFVWNKRSISGSEYDSITIDGARTVRHIWSDGNGLYLISVSIGGKTQIRQYDGKTFVVIHELGKQTRTTPGDESGHFYEELIIGRNAIVVTDIGSVFITNLGNVYCLSLGGSALHKINKLNGDNVPEEHLQYFDISITKANIDVGNQDMAYSQSQQKFVAPGGDDSIEYSSSGTSWTNVSLTAIDANTAWISAAYSPTLDIWVCVGVFGTVNAISSPNATTWTARTLAATPGQQWGNVRWIGGTIAKFIATSFSSSNQIAYSSNGTSWTVVNLGSGITLTQRPLCFNSNTNEVYAIATNGTIVKSSDGITWTTVATTPNSTGESMAYSPVLDKYVIRGSGTGAMWHTEDFVTFTPCTGVVSYQSHIQYIPQKDIFIGARFTQNGGFNYSLDGETWYRTYNGGTSYSAMVYADHIGKMFMRGQDARDIYSTPLDLKELDIDGENIYRESATVLYYGNGTGFADVNEENGLMPGVPHLQLFYFAENDYKNQGLRAQKLFLHNIKNINTSQMDSELTSFGCTKFDIDIYPLEGNVLTGVRLLPKLSIAQNLTIYCNPVPNEDPELEDAEIGYIDIYVNQKTTPVQTKVVTRKIASKGYIDIEMNQLNVNAIQIGIRWNTEHQTGENDMMLSQAVLTYKPIYSSR